MSLGSIESELRLTSIASSDLHLGSSDSALESGEGCSLDSGDPGLPVPLSPVSEEQRVVSPKQGETTALCSTLNIHLKDDACTLALDFLRPKTVVSFLADRCCTCYK